MNINIISIGKIREKYIQQGVNEFLKRLTPYTSVKITELPAEEIKSEDIKEKALQKEAERILGKVHPDSCVIALDVKGKQLSSEGFAEKIGEILSQGTNQLIFIIGGSEGLHRKVKSRADFLLSISEMTFPHQLMRLILLEQIYRAFRIRNNEPYHK